MNDIFRQQFPALQRQHNGKPLVFLDGPAGTQVPNKVINAISDYYKTSNANVHGAFITTQETDEIMDATRLSIANLLGAESPHTISLGQNMTTLNYSLSKAIARSLRAGDEILITQLDHEANRGPWLSLLEQGVVVREIKLLDNGTLDYKDFEAKVNEKTRLVAIGFASNIFGTINDIAYARKLSYQVGAWLLIDGVHAAPHFPLDVQALGCDFFLCSAYKFYGPHVGILYTRPGLLDQLSTDRLRTADQKAPHSIETGTLNHAAMAGVNAAVEFIAEQGEGLTQRQQILSAMQRIQAHESSMLKMLYGGLNQIDNLQIIGPPVDLPMRSPTLAITITGKHPKKICQALAKQNICAWAGHFYAIRATEVLGLLEQGGVTRLGISAYTNENEVSATIEGMKTIAKNI